MVAVPAAIPATIPVPEPIVATPGALLLHTPPGVGLLNVAKPPEHTCAVPAIAPGDVLIVIIFVAKQPADSV